MRSAAEIAGFDLSYEAWRTALRALDDIEGFTDAEARDIAWKALTPAKWPGGMSPSERRRYRESRSDRLSA